MRLIVIVFEYREVDMCYNINNRDVVTSYANLY